MDSASAGVMEASGVAQGDAAGFVDEVLAQSGLEVASPVDGG